MSFALNGIYPTHPIWLVWIAVAIFEIVVIVMEAMIIDAVMKDRLKSNLDRYVLGLLVVIVNIVTFLIGLGLQIIMI